MLATRTAKESACWMKVLVLHGSPRKDGSSDTLVEHLIKGMRSSRSIDLEEFYTNDLNVRPCQMCVSCSKPPEYACVIKDDMQAIYSAFSKADVVVFATPMLWGYMTAQLKTVLDRMEAIASRRHLEGKTFVVIVTYRHHYESTIAFFRRAFAEYFGVKLHSIVYRSVDEKTGTDRHVSECQDRLNEAQALGMNLGRQKYAEDEETTFHNEPRTGSS